MEGTWGEWPKAEKMELQSENRTGMWYDIGEFKALIIPIPTGKQSSRLWRNPQLRALNSPISYHIPVRFSL